MCDNPTETEEHAPPKSFFPKDSRQGLIKVPSCWQHNNGNSEEVEIAKNVVTSSDQINSIGLEICQTKTIPSLKRNQNLLGKTFPEIFIREGKSLHRPDMQIYISVMRGIVYALYHHDFGKRFPYFWGIYNASFEPRKVLVDGESDPVNPQMRASFAQFPYVKRDTKYPAIFTYGIYQERPEEIVYRLEFYEGFLVYAISVKDKNLLRD